MTDRTAGYVPLAVVADLMTARVAVARLESEGIRARVHGDGAGPYRLTVGDLAATEIWVPADRLAEAREVMLIAEVDALEPAGHGDPTPGWPLRWVALGAAVLLAVLAYRLLAGLV